jgi:hypothetical protein
MFNGDIRKQEIELVMARVRKMSLAQMKSLYHQIAQHHDALVLKQDPKWVKPGGSQGGNPHWENHL